MNKFKSRRTHEQFIEKINERYPNREWEVIGIYEHNMIPILLRDKYGDCLILPNALMQKSQPSIKTAVNPTEYTVNKFKDVWGERFDYSKFIYSGVRVKSTIICKVHGEFEQNANMHISGRCGCVKCANEAVSNRVKSNTKDFIKKSIERWGHNALIYNKAVYTGAKEPILIFCEKCKDYYKTLPNSHYSGNGCLKCANDNKGYSRSDYIKQAKGRDAIIYLIKCFNKTEEFYKIGITLQGIEARFGSVDKLPYDYKEVCAYKGEAGFIWDMEKKYHKKYKEYKYIPKINFGGYTECFNTSLPTEEIIKYLE